MTKLIALLIALAVNVFVLLAITHNGAISGRVLVIVILSRPEAVPGSAIFAAIVHAIAIAVLLRCLIPAPVAVIGGASVVAAVSAAVSVAVAIAVTGSAGARS